LNDSRLTLFGQEQKSKVIQSRGIGMDFIKSVS